MIGFRVRVHPAYWSFPTNIQSRRTCIFWRPNRNTCNVFHSGYRLTIPRIFCGSFPWWTGGTFGRSNLIRKKSWGTLGANVQFPPGNKTSRTVVTASSILGGRFSRITLCTILRTPLTLIKPNLAYLAIRHRRFICISARRAQFARYTSRMDMHRSIAELPRWTCFADRKCGR